MRKRSWAFLCFALCCSISFATSLIPSPSRMEMYKGCLKIREKSIVVYAEDTTFVPVRFLLKEIIGIDNTTIKHTQNPRKADIVFHVKKNGHKEAYNLEINAEHISIEASDKAGFMHASRTLQQWKKTDKKGNTIFDYVRISDEPMVSWRGFMLDSGRQYQSVATIKKYIEMASILKMNVFHWHLTEGLGWRVEIKKYPHLTQKGAFVGKGEEQQGFYSQEDIREIVQYATERCITVVPEIDMPGHAEAALSAYPELGCFGQPVEIPERGFTQNIFCAGKESTIKVLKDILDEVCDLFPSPYIHLGGDEAPKGNWNTCHDCQQRIADLHLKDSHDLQLWFSAEMANHLKKKGRKAIFWGDVLYQMGHPLPENVVIQWWNYRGHGDLALRNAHRLGYPVICSTNYYNYLNFPVTPWRGYQKNRTFDLKHVYSENPSYQAVLEDNPLTLGMTCALWTDDGVKESMIDQRVFPRILALAEQMWHNQPLCPLEVFHERILQRKAWFESLGYIFGPAFQKEVSESYKWE